MTDQQLLPPPEEVPEPVVAAPIPPQRDMLPWLSALGFVLLAAAVFYLWRYPPIPSDTSANATAIHAVEQHLADVDARLARLEQRPVVDLGKITARLDVLEGRVGDQTELASRLDVVSGRIEALAGRSQTGLDGLKQQLDAVSARISSLESNVGGFDAVTKRLNRIARLQEASFALDAGRPIGDVPDAPPALARYAHAAPPTEAQLRRRFPRDKQVALSVKQPDDNDSPFIDRVLDRAQSLITIRRGSQIVVGNDAAIVLGRAETDLDTGDLLGAVTEVKSLNGQPAQAMATWLADAQALLGARSALVQMADQA